MIDNLLVAQKLFRIAELLEFDDPKGYKAPAFERAAKTILKTETPLANLDYTKLKNVGSSTSKCIKELLESNGMLCTRLSKLEEQYPPTIMTLTEIPGVSPKRALALAKKHDVKDLMEMYALVKKGNKKISKKLSLDVVFAVEEKQRKPRYLILPILEVLRAAVHATPAIKDTLWVGSIRRCRSSVKNADLLVTLVDNTPETKEVALDHITRIIREEYRAKILPVGLSGKSDEHLVTNWPIKEHGFIPVEVIFTTPESAGAACFFYTGSKAHNTAIARLARTNGLKINETGILSSDGRYLGGALETEVYDCVGLPYWEPVFRDESDLEKTPPNSSTSIYLKDITRCVHVHTDWDDPSFQKITEAATAAMDSGCFDIAITGNSNAPRFQSAGSEAAYIQSCRAVESRLSLGSNRAVTIRPGIEVEITPEGTLSWAQPRLQKIEWVVATIQRKFNTDIERRLLSAINNPAVNMIGHITGRIIGERGLPDDVDWQKVFLSAAHRDVIIEINCQPNRMDPPRELLLLAKSCGCKFAISSEPSRPEHFWLRENGVDMARRSWLKIYDMVQ